MTMPVTFSPDHELDAMHSLLDTWNADADRFRRAAIAAERGETPTPSVVTGLAEAHAGLLEVLEATDRMVTTMHGGNAAFSAILHLQTKALALLESLSHSLDVLDRFVTEPASEPVKIGHPAGTSAAREPVPEGQAATG
jgi:hypothetical protein